MSTIILPSRCDRAAAEALLPEMVAALGGGSLKIDARLCNHVGQAMLQLLVSARRSNEGAHIEPSQMLVDMAHQVGLAHELFDGGVA